MATVLCNKCKRELDYIDDEYVRGLIKPKGTSRNDQPHQDYNFVIICPECAGLKEGDDY